MSPAALRLLGLVLTLTYAAFTVWLYATQPRTLAEVRGGMAATVGAYTIDRPSFDEGLRLFRADRFAEARLAFQRADPAQRDPVVQFYVAYSFLRQGWGRFYRDEALYAQARDALERAVAAAPGGAVRVDDPALSLHTADELRGELDRQGVGGWARRP